MGNLYAATPGQNPGAARIYIYIYKIIYIWSRPAAGKPPFPAPMVSPSCPPMLVAWPYTTIHVLYSHAGLMPPIHYPHDTSMQGSRFTAYMPIQPIQSICNLLLPMQYLYSSHVLATVMISCAIHTFWLCTTTYTIYMIPL